MKKNFIYSVMALFVCLFAACSQEEIVSDGELGNSKVSLSVKIPAVGPVSRAADLTVEGYTMHCIMELVDANGDLIVGTERMTKDVTNGTASFEFTKPTGQYSCVFWAEYVNADGKSFYKTSNGLKQISYDGNKKSTLFNNKATDAFCGKLSSSAITTSPKITLKRPFTRIAISKTELAKLGSSLNQCVPSINSAQGYNVVTGKTIEAVTLSPTTDDILPVPADGDDAFFCYVFPAKDNVAVTKVSNIAFSDSQNPDTKKTISITADQMKEMTPNVAVNLKPKDETPDSGNIKVEIEIDNSFDNGGGTTEPENPTTPETPTAVAIGHFLYSDGTTSATVDAQKTCVGIVFHVGKYEGDNGVYPMGTVKGYAVALKDASEEGVKWSNTAWANITISNMVQESKANYDAYSYNQLTADVEGTAYNELLPVKTAREYNVNVDKTKTSGWYLPTSFQLKDIYDNLATIDPKFEALGANATKLQPTIYWGCVIATSGKPFRLQFDANQTAEAGNAGKATGSNSAQRIRAILTF